MDLDFSSPNQDRKGQADTFSYWLYARLDIPWSPVNHMFSQRSLLRDSAVQNVLLGGGSSVREELKLWSLKSLAVFEPWNCAQDLRSQILLRLWHRGFCSGRPQWWIWPWKRSHNIFTPYCTEWGVFVRECWLGVHALRHDLCWLHRGFILLFSHLKRSLGIPSQKENSEVESHPLFRWAEPGPAQQHLGAGYHKHSPGARTQTVSISP